MTMGVPQTLDSSIAINPLESTINNNTTEQQTTIGPVASLESIKLLVITEVDFLYQIQLIHLKILLVYPIYMKYF